MKGRRAKITNNEWMHLNMKTAPKWQKEMVKNYENLTELYLRISKIQSSAALGMVEKLAQKKIRKTKDL